ncbi:hypothetical protein DYB37_002600 [Aphanomyces astaci]|nr:hypothetical protein DYB37_002600 [Aphanomyces astaci]
MANFEADYNDLTEVPLELVSLASLRTISLMYNGAAGSLQSLSPTLETLRPDGIAVEAVPPTVDVALLTSKRLRIQGTQPPVRSFTPCLLMPASMQPRYHPPHSPYLSSSTRDPHKANSTLVPSADQHPSFLVDELLHDLMRLKLSDKDTHVHENDQRHHEVAAQISAADLRVASLGRAQDVVADQLRQAQAKWNAQHNDHDHRIAQTFELAHTLSAGQTLLEEKHVLETQIVTSQFHKVFQRLQDTLDKQTMGDQALERCVANVHSEVTTLQALHDLHATEMKEHVRALRGQCIQNTTALRLLADEVLKLKQRAKTQDFGRQQQHDHLPPRRHPERDSDKALMAELDHALRHTSYTT